MGSALSDAFLRVKPFSSFEAGTASAAIADAEKALPPTIIVRKLDKIELVHGFDSNRPDDNTWNVQFEVDQSSGPLSKPTTVRRTIDVVVAPDGKANILELPEGTAFSPKF